MTRIILDPSQSSLSCGSSNLAGAVSILSPLISTLIEAPHTNQSPINSDFLLHTSPFFLILPSPPHILLTLLQPCHKSPKKSSPPAPPSPQSLTLSLTHANLLLSSSTSLSSQPQVDSGLDITICSSLVFPSQLEALTQPHWRRPTLSGTTILQ